MSISDWPGLGCQSAYAPLQVIGVNEYFGWFDIDGTTEDRAALGPFMRTVRACYPNQSIFVTEFGFGGNRNGPVEVRGTYLYQINSLQYHVGVFNALPWLSGAIYFPIQDFAARPDFAGGDPLGTPPWVDKYIVNALVDGGVGNLGRLSDLAADVLDRRGQCLSRRRHGVSVAAGLFASAQGGPRLLRGDDSHFIDCRWGDLRQCLRGRSERRRKG